MKQYTITLTVKGTKELLFKETVKADNKQEAWDMVEVSIKKAMRDKGTGEIEIKEGV